MTTIDYDFDAASNEIFGKAENKTNSAELVVLSLALANHLCEQTSFFNVFRFEESKFYKFFRATELTWSLKNKFDPCQWETGKWFDKALEGDVIAQNNLGCCYFDEENYSEAVLWIEKAAEQGLPEAQLGMGLCYYYGDGVEKDDNKAIEWIKKAAEQGDAFAQFMLGMYYYEVNAVNGIFWDQSLWFPWFSKAAEQGLPEAQYFLGRDYLDSVFVWQKEESLRWLARSAEQGFPPSQYWLGYCYENGIVVGKDGEKAVEWYHKAAKQGNIDAKVKLLDY